MIYEWDISKTEQPGGGWLVHRASINEVVNGNPEEPASLSITREVDSDSVRVLAYTTLDNARRAVGRELRLDKRIRLKKLSATHYTYTYRLKN